MNFYHTATDRDKAGNTFVGIQITGDPGVEVVYTGFSVISLGAVIYIRRKMLGRR
jgi:3D (Asp-Asp-Asp) domain-containing protein